MPWLLADPLRALLALLLALSLAFGAWKTAEDMNHQHQLAAAHTELAQARQAASDERAQRAAAAELASETFRKTEHQAVAAAQENDHALQQAIAARDAARRGERDAERLLHDAAEAFTAAGRGDGAQSCPAALDAERHRSATLRDLFEEADGAAGELADAAERHADEARALKRQLQLDREVKP